MTNQGEGLVAIGMRAVVRDLQDWVLEHAWRSRTGDVVDANLLSAYLLACLITSGAYDDADDPFGELRREMALDHGES